MQLSDELYRRLEEKAGPFSGQVYGLRLTEGGRDGIEFAQLLVHYGYLDRDSAGDIIAEQFGRTYVNLGETLFQQDLLDRLPAELAHKLGAIPLYRLGNKATVGMVNPADEKAIRSLESLLMSPISPVFCFQDEVESAIEVNYRTAQDFDKLLANFDLTPFLREEIPEAQLRALLESEQLVQLSETLLLLALKDRASDIHIEPKPSDVLVRMRVDGGMTDKLRLPKSLLMPLVSRYKVIAQLDIADRRRPQDGRFDFALGMRKMDIRVSTMPTIRGEKVVLRILGAASTSATLNLDKLNLAPEVLAPLTRVIQQPSGILFVTGPTGSGKTTTLYAALNFINSPDINVVTIEDPVEYDVPSISQIQVNDKAGRSFQTVLRSVLRQDPDVILVGEIRDVETARIATQAAMTGHLVLTTLHTGNAIQATTRLIDMGVDRFMVAPSLIGVLSQRLVRRICELCKVEYDPAPEYLEQYFSWRKGYRLPPLYRGEGCEHCGKSGYHGRIGIHEFLNVTTRLREALLEGKRYDELHALAVAGGFKEMRHDGFKKALRGLTTIEEVLKATSSDQD
jgi:type IV pilus assembly protein PilB